MTVLTLAFLFREIELGRALEASIAVLFLGAMAYGGWSIAGLVAT